VRTLRKWVEKRGGPGWTWAHQHVKWGNKKEHQGDEKTQTQGRRKAVKIFQVRDAAVSDAAEILLRIYLKGRAEKWSEADSTGKITEIFLFFFFFLEIDSYYVAQTGLELLGAYNSPASVSHEAETIGPHNCTWLRFPFWFFVVFLFFLWYWGLNSRPSP
jgi:hypothetical protein